MRCTLAAVGTFVVGISLGGALHALSIAVVPTAVATLSLLVYARLVASPRAEAGSLDVSPDGVMLTRGGATATLAAKDLSAAWVVPSTVGASVEFLRANGDVFSAELRSVPDAHLALAAAGIDARKRAVRVLLGGRWDGLGYGLATVLFVLLQGAPMFLLFSLLARLDATSSIALAVMLLTVACMVGARLLGPAEITLGADGVSWKRGFSRGFIPHRDLASVDVWHGNDIVLRERSGETVLITHSRRDPARVAGMVELIRGAMARIQGAGDSHLELLDRGGRTIEHWRASLRALVSARAYREAGLTREDLSRALDAPDATVERRLGAAFALVATGDSEALARVRVAADACASDGLREALLGIARDEINEATITRAMRGT